MPGAYYNEIDAKAAAWLRELIRAGVIAAGDVDERSVVDVRPDDLRGYRQCHFFAGIGVWSYALRAAGWNDEREVWTGSCPCQPFSAAGGGAGFEDERHLWPSWYALIRECRPGVVFGEQVASKDGLAWLDLVQPDMEDARYAFAAVDLCAAGVGAPHIRQRLFFVADAGLPEWRPPPARGHDDFGNEPDRTEGSGGAGERGAVERLAHAADAERRAGACRPEEGARARGLGRERSTGDSVACVLGDAGGTGQQGREQRASRHDDGRRPEAHGPACESGGALGPCNGFWRDCEWLPCLDGKARPVEPGTSPLADGTPARVVRLRGYGNSINAEVARAFIEAYLDVIDNIS